MNNSVYCVYIRNSFLIDYTIFIITIVLFRVILDFVYIQFVSPVYLDSFLSFKVKFDIYQYIVSWIIYLLCFLITSYKFKKISDYFFLSSVLYVIAPLLSIYGLDADRHIFPVVVTIGAIFFVFLISNKMFFIKVPKIPRFTNGNMMLLVLSWGIIFYLIIWYCVSGAVLNINYHPEQMYEVRAINGKITDISILSYLNLWAYKFFSIFLICYYLYKKKYFIVFVIFCIQFFCYGINNHRITLFLPFLTVVIWYYFKKTDKLVVLPILYILVILFSYLAYALFGHELAAAILIRRVFYVPAGLTFEWFNFFSSHQHVFWSDKLLSSFISYPYNWNIPRTVGEYLLRDELAANNGYISSGYAHAGVLGVLIYSGILGYIIKFLDVMGRRGIPMWFLLALTAGPLRTILTDSDLLTSIVSHGLVIAIFMSIFFEVFPRRGNPL